MWAFSIINRMIEANSQYHPFAAMLDASSGTTPDFLAETMTLIETDKAPPAIRNTAFARESALARIRSHSSWFCSNESINSPNKFLFGSVLKKRRPQTWQE